MFEDRSVITEFSAPDVHVAIEFVGHITVRSWHPSSVNKNDGWLARGGALDFSLDSLETWELVVLTQSLSDEFEDWLLSFSLQIEFEEITVSVLVVVHKEWNFFDSEWKSGDQTLLRSVVDSTELNEWVSLGNFVEETGEGS